MDNFFLLETPKKFWLELVFIKLNKNVQNSQNLYQYNIWVKVFKNGPGEICGRQLLKNLKF